MDLRHPYVRAELPLPGLDPACLTVCAELVNAGADPVAGVLEGEVSAPDTGETVATFRKPFVLWGHQTRGVTFAPAEAPSLVLRSPRLWWPNTYGDQPLYGLRLRARADGVLAAAEETRFGIRRLDRELHERHGAHGLVLRVNGRRIFQRGGYVQPEMMFDWDRGRVAAEIGYLAEANLNYVVFEDIPNPPDWYLDLCDEHGILFWNCFYGCYWLQPERRWDVDLRVLEDGTADLVKRYRNHPCLVVYMAQNEGETRQDVYGMWRRSVLALDDTRFLVPSGSFPDYRTGTPQWFAADLPVGMNDYPPKSYSWQLPWVYHRLVRDQPNWMFMIESGSASVPPLESLERFLPGLADLGPNPGDAPHYPLDAAWAHFGANAYFEWFDRGLRLLYGEPRDVRDYVWKAQLVSFDQHRALFEAVHHRMWEITSGLGEWKLNSAFPDVQWQVYDWFLRPMASLFAIRRAGAAVSVLRCPLDGVVGVVNNAPQPLAGLRVGATVYDLGLTVLQQYEARLDAAAEGYTESFAVAGPASAAEHPVYFVYLEVHDPGGALVADNFYWLSPRLEDCEILYTGDMRQFPANRPLAVPRSTPCFAELAELAAQTVRVEAGWGDGTAGLGGAAAAPRVGGEPAVTVRVTNPGPGLAFFTRLRLVRAGDGEEILPVYWSDNYVSLLPGQSRQVTARLAGAPDGGVRVAVDGWNVPAVGVPVRPPVAG
ncbi:MAG: hypothetical protein AB1505_13820 [Candidatus Latescibacterota bacterium]